MTDDAVHLIHRDRIIRGTVRSRLPGCVEGLSWYEPGTVPHSPEMLAAVALTVTRCAPWVRLYLGPRLWSACATADAGTTTVAPSCGTCPGGGQRMSTIGPVVTKLLPGNNPKENVLAFRSRLLGTSFDLYDPGLWHS